MIKPARVALQARFDLPQPPRTAKLAEQHRDQLRLALDLSLVLVGIVLVHKPIESRPPNLLQKLPKNDILLPHGVDPLLVFS